MQQTHLEVNTSNTREQSLGLSNTENQKPSTPSEDSTRCLAIGSSQRSRTGSQGLSSSHSGNPRQPQSRFLRPSATRAARPGRGRGREGDARQPSGPRASLRSPEPPSGCWTAPTPARPCPGSPPSRNSRARAARGRSRGPAAPWSRALRYLWRRGSSRAAAAERRSAACALLAHGPVFGARPLPPGRPAPAQLPAPSPLNSYLSPPALPPSTRAPSGVRMRNLALPAARGRPLAVPYHTTAGGRPAASPVPGNGKGWQVSLRNFDRTFPESYQEHAREAHVLCFIKDY